MWVWLTPERPAGHPALPEGTTRRELWVTGTRRMSTALMDRLLVYGTSALGTGSFFWMPALAYLTYRRWHQLSRLTRFIIIAGLLSLFIVRKVHRPWVRRLFFWDAWLKYLSARVVFDDDPGNGGVLPAAAAATGRAVVAIRPHGVFPFALALPLFRGFVDVFGLLRPVAADAVFRVPFLGHLVSSTGGMPARWGEMIAALRGGDRIVVSPGGVAEMFHSEVVGEDFTGRPERLVMARRTGLASMAMRTGAPIIPVYTFGAAQVFRLLPASWLTERLSRWARASLVLFAGRFGLPIPRAPPLLFAVGRAIYPPAVADPPAAADVEGLHREVLAEFRHLYHRYKGVYDPRWRSRGLEIL